MDILEKIDDYLNEQMKIKDWWYDHIANLFYKMDGNTKIQILLNGLQGKKNIRVGGQPAIPTGMVRVQWSKSDVMLSPTYLKSIDFTPSSKTMKDIVLYVDKNLKKLESKAKRGGAALDEKWEKEVKIKSTGEYTDKSVEELKKILEKLKGKKPFDREKYSEVMFAIRAKKGWKGGV